jgi:hypothetical protein
MLRCFQSSFLEPLRSAGSAVALAVSTLLLWGTVVVFVLLNAESATQVQHVVGYVLKQLRIALFVPVLVLALPLISAELRDRTLFLKLMQPISRTNYYAGRVLGRVCFCATYLTAALGGLYVVLQLLQSVSFGGGIAIPDDLAWSLIFTGLSMLTVTVSLAALAPLSSSRFGHAGYWGGLYVIVLQARDLRATAQSSELEKQFAAVVLEVLQPLILGAAPHFANDASLGHWYAMRAAMQWGFGISLAFALGLMAFNRMELGTGK